MGNEMGNNNTSGPKDEENTTVEACKTSLVDTTHENGTKEHQLLPEIEGKEFHEKVTNLAHDDPERNRDPCVENQTSSLSKFEREDTEVHPLGDSPKVTMESTEAGERDSKMQSDTEKKMEETDLQGRIQYQLLKQDSSKKKDEEDGKTSTPHDLEPKADTTVEACKTALLDSTRENYIKEEKHLVAEVEGNDFHEKVANLASDDRKRIEDPCFENQTLSMKEQEDTEVHLGESMESTRVWKNDSKVQPDALLSDLGHEEPIEPKNEETGIQGMLYQLEKQDSFKKEDEEAKDSKNFESNQQELATIHTDQSVEDGSGSLLGSDDFLLGSTLTSDFKANVHRLDTETNMEDSADSSTGPALEKKEDDMLLEQKASQEQLKSLEEKFETKDGEEVENGSSNVSLIESHDLDGLGNNCDGEFPTEMNLVRNDDISKLEPEALVETNSLSSHLEVPEPEEKCIILKEEISLIGKESENGEKKHDKNTIHTCGESMMQSESDIEKSSEPQFESTMVEPTHDNRDKVSVIGPLNDKDSHAEEPKVAENGDLVVVCLNNQDEAFDDQYRESEKKGKVVPELGINSTELTIPQFNHKEEESVGKRTVQDREDKTEPLLGIEIEETETPEQYCLSPEESTVFGFESVQRINDSIPELNQKNCGECFATETSTIHCTSWIAEALVSMNKLEAEMLGQQATQLTEAPQAVQLGQQAIQLTEAPQAEAAAQTKISAEVETSSAYVSSGSETQETVGRSSTVSTESEPDNLNIIHARIQKSPSFSLDLQNEARTEESDSTPLLYQDKAEIESSQSQGEKVITLERSESEESKTPFLGFLKEEGETHVVVAQNKHENHSPSENSKKNLCDSVTGKATPTSSKGKEKRRHRPSIFSNCLCCATVIN